ncbi:MAG: patatin-like phospholipase family protein [Candidatus Marinimicrobia bacterium]|nr:patatin-like phospholipase family protein [Candidatus Neomarinimicrobiota bacterium]MCF7850472.1 patatin-like phospholipase family protein [Candidatus Neomarinimicrobiota bacterium]MCF7905052.1 patatin-like phospholipase family protein [Candidatus Neomarinimicrobiota bacterium]
MAKPRFGLALGGGGARGFAHIGVLKRLEEEGYKPEFVTGASMGSLVGAVYTRTGSADATWEILDGMVSSEAFGKLGLHLINVNKRGGTSFWHQVSLALHDRIVINLAQTKKGLVSLERIEAAVKVAITEDIWSNDGMQLGIVATDLYNGEDVYFTEGSLAQAVMASIAIPGFLPPVEIDGRVLVDGGVSQQIPIRMAREMGADFVFGVDVGQDVEPVTELDNAMAIMSQSENIRSCHYRDMLNREADVLLDMEMPGVHWSAYDQRAEFVRIGKESFNKLQVTFEQAWYQREHPLMGRIKNLF